MIFFRNIYTRVITRANKFASSSTRGASFQEDTFAATPISSLRLSDISSNSRGRLARVRLGEGRAGLSGTHGSGYK